jgi:RNA polymerase sigma-70 factor (ECF subfamily)
VYRLLRPPFRLSFSSGPFINPGVVQQIGRKGKGRTPGYRGEFRRVTDAGIRAYLHPMETREDIEAMLARMALGDRAAFAQLYDATSAKLFGIACRVLKDRGEAEEALQEAFLRIWHKADRYQVNGLSPMTWLITVTRNLCIDRLRARGAMAGPMGEAAEIVADPAPGPEAQAVATSERARIDSCLDELEAERARAVRGAYLDGQSYAELAAQHDVPLNTMRTWLRRSLLKLRECLSR